MDAPGFMVAKKRVCIPYRHTDRVKPYVAAVEAAGLEALAISVDQFPTLDGADGLLLTGGTDVNPRLFGQNPQEQVDTPDNVRDEVELRLLRQALEQDMPVLCICRGMQLLNVQLGGTLIQHLGSPRHDTEFADKSTIAHEVAVEPGSLLERIVGAARIAVNSRHHQAVDRVAEGLIVSACDSEDPHVIEGLEHSDRQFVVAVQWHPEDQAPRSPEQRRIFESFAEACQFSAGAVKR